jgi:hypothetical protein
MRNVLAGCVLAILILAPVPVWAVHPFVVEETNTQGKGNFRFELNGDYTKLRNGGNKITDMNGILTAGTGDNTDLTLEVPYLILDPSPTTDKNEQGIGDAQLKVKYRLYENEVKQSLGLLIYTSLPIGDKDKGLGTSKLLLGIQVMDQQECHNNIIRVSVGLETLGWQLRGTNLGEHHALRYGIAVEHKFTESFRLLSELAGESRRSFNKPYEPVPEEKYTQPATFMAGFRYDLSRSWYVDLAGRAGLNKDAEDYSALVGTAWKY